MSSGYKVISQHGAAARTRTRVFDTDESAVEYALTLRPSVDGTTVPNVSGPMVTKAEQSELHYWRSMSEQSNRYAVIVTVHAQII